MERCPACRARLQVQAVCPRCACDFTLAQGAEVSAQQHLIAAVAALAANDRSGAQAALQQSMHLRRSALATFLMHRL